MIEDLKNNVRTESNLVRELINFSGKIQGADPAEAEIIQDIMNSIKKRIKLVNDSIPSIVRGLTIGQNFKDVKLPNIKNVSYGVQNPIAVRSKDLEKFMEELNISKGLIKKLKKEGVRKEKKITMKRGGGFYSKLSNRFFLGMSQGMLSKGSFKSLVKNLKKSNIDILSSSYISMMFFTTLLGGFLGIGLFVFFLFINISSIPPFISIYAGDFFIRILQTSWLIIGVPAVTFLLFYIYPGVEKRNLGKKIDQELPFMVIQMGSISGSGIEPVEIFKIIGLSGDYKYAGREIVKLLNQINIYGYDLVTALTNISRSTPSPRLSELLVGLATTISSGGDLDAFFEKRAESLLLEYTLEREKFTKVAETFMDIYISVVIATPMILLLLLVLISVSGVGLGIGITEISLLIILLVAVVNILFLVFLNMKQPKY